MQTKKKYYHRWAKSAFYSKTSENKSYACKHCGITELQVTFYKGGKAIAITLYYDIHGGFLGIRSPECVPKKQSR